MPLKESLCNLKCQYSSFQNICKASSSMGTLWGHGAPPEGTVQPRSLHAMKVTVSLQSAGPVSLPQPALETRGGRWQLFVEEDRAGGL